MDITNGKSVEERMIKESERLSHLFSHYPARRVGTAIKQALLEAYAEGVKDSAKIALKMDKNARDLWERGWSTSLNRTRNAILSLLPTNKTFGSAEEKPVGERQM